ncbi:MAG: hypothetical protein AB8U25_03675 [Rickettsiales endosymbiont of Dermacentor nuttalli]
MLNNPKAIALRTNNTATSNMSPSGSFLKILIKDKLFSKLVCPGI